MLYWALQWHEGRQVSDGALCDVLWGEFASKPKDPGASLREMAHVQNHYSDKWDLQDCDGKAFRILPRREAAAPKDDSKRAQKRAGVVIANARLGAGESRRPANDNREP